MLAGGARIFPLDWRTGFDYDGETRSAVIFLSAGLIWPLCRLTQN